MDKNVYIVATIRPWHIMVYHEIIRYFPGKWHLITDAADLKLESIKSLNPKYIFFPHWSHIVPEEILDFTECVCFHETDLPFGRGGSPIQNLIDRGYKETIVSALRMTGELDAGPIYMKSPLSLYGLAEEIFIRSSKVIAQMIMHIIAEEPGPREQQGEISTFTRRTLEQSMIPLRLKSVDELFDHIRMLDATEYPTAFIEYAGFRFDFSRPAKRTGVLDADVRITKCQSVD